MPGFRLLRRAREDVLEVGSFTAERWGEGVCRYGHGFGERRGSGTLG